jgi:hypothetical protein
MKNEDYRYAREGESCQSCHMPDAVIFGAVFTILEMVRRALNVEPRLCVGEVMFEVRSTPYKLATTFRPISSGRGRDRNLTGADGANRRLLTRRVIGRLTDTALKREVADTRIPAGKSLSFGADFPSPRSQDASVELRITVAPKAFYERVFARTLGEETHLPAAAATQLREALADARASRFTLYRIRRLVRE